MLLLIITSTERMVHDLNIYVEPNLLPIMFNTNVCSMNQCYCEDGTALNTR